MNGSERVRLAEFPDYEIDLAGYVVSHIFGRPRILRPIKMGAYVGLQLRDKDGVRQKRYLHRLVADSIRAGAKGGLCIAVMRTATTQTIITPISGGTPRSATTPTSCATARPPSAQGTPWPA